MFLRCSYFFAKSEADVLINSVLIKRKACIALGRFFAEPSDGHEYFMVWALSLTITKRTSKD